MILICILKIQANLELGKQIANLIIISIVNQICFIGLPVCQKYQTKIASALGMYSIERVIPPTFQYNRKSNYLQASTIECCSNSSNEHIQKVWLIRSVYNYITANRISSTFHLLHFYNIKPITNCLCVKGP